MLCMKNLYSPLTTAPSSVILLYRTPSFPELTFLPYPPRPPPNSLDIGKSEILPRLTDSLVFIDYKRAPKPKRHQPHFRRTGGILYRCEMSYLYKPVHYNLCGKFRQG